VDVKHMPAGPVSAVSIGVPACKLPRTVLVSFDGSPTDIVRSDSHRSLVSRRSLRTGHASPRANRTEPPTLSGTVPTTPIAPPTVQTTPIASTEPPPTVQTTPIASIAMGPSTADESAPSTSGSLDDDHIAGAPLLSKASETTTYPDFSTLQTWPATRLRSVDGFRVRHRKYGEILWLQPVDLRGVNLNCIRFQPCSLDVNDAPVALNCPARITLFGCWPQQQTLRKEHEDQHDRLRPPTTDRDLLYRHEQHLRDVTDKLNGRFVGFDRTTASWTFLVDRFH
jgi:hypothetical protein